MRYAGFWIRFWASVVDLLALTALGLGLGALFMLPLGLINLTDPSWSGNGYIWLYFTLANSILAWLYSTLFESGAWQATPGKRLLGIRVTDLQGNKISFARATGRYFAKYLSALILYIGYLMVGLTDKKQGLHDHMAETLVVRGKAGESEIHIEPFLAGDTLLVQKRWVMAGFDDTGHVVRLTFVQDHPKLDLDGLVIGRDSKSCDLHMDDQSVSRQHARIIRRDGLIMVEDLGSRNGILINGKTVPKRKTVMLPDEGKITIGSVELSIGKY